MATKSPSRSNIFIVIIFFVTSGSTHRGMWCHNDKGVDNLLPFRTLKYLPPNLPISIHQRHIAFFKLSASACLSLSPVIVGPSFGALFRAVHLGATKMRQNKEVIITQIWFESSQIGMILLMICSFSNRSVPYVWTTRVLAPVRIGWRRFLLSPCAMDLRTGQ